MSRLSTIVIGLVGGGLLIGLSNMGENLGTYRVYTYFLLYIVFIITGNKLYQKKEGTPTFKKRFAIGFTIFSIISISYFLYEATSSNYFSRISSGQRVSMLVFTTAMGLALSALIAFLMKKRSK